MMNAIVEIDPGVLAAAQGGQQQRAEADIVLGRTVTGGALFGGTTWLANRIAAAAIPGRFMKGRVQSAVNLTRWITSSVAAFEGAKLGRTGHY